MSEWMVLYESSNADGPVLQIHEDRRNAELSAGAAYQGEYESCDLTRDEARAFAAALNAYADTVDSGPGAPFPLKSIFTAFQRIQERQRDVEEDGHGGWRVIS